jgi:hypothetical protein
MQNFLSSIDEKFVAPLSLARPTVLKIYVRDAGSATSVDGLVVREPRNVHLAFHEIGVEEALTTRPSEAEDDAGVLATLICLPSGTRTPFELQKRAEGWMASRPNERGAPYEVPYRSDRILWRRGRALCIGTGEFIDDVRNAIAYFAYCEWELSNLEDRIASAWPKIQTDLSLTHAVAKPELKRQGTVDKRTVEAHAMRLDFIRLSTALERLDRVLSAPAQRIVTELSQQADTVDRLRLLDDAIEFAQETYDTANDRLTEYRYFRTEYGIEVIIAAILLVELIAVCVDIWLNW